MAKQVITKMTDDLDGGEATETVVFGVDGTEYEIDLSEKNAAKLRDGLAAFVSSGTRLGRTNRQHSVAKSVVTADDRAKNAKVRAWARDNNHDVSDRGRIPAEIMAEYEAAQRKRAASPAGEPPPKKSGPVIPDEQNPEMTEKPAKAPAKRAKKAAAKVTPEFSGA